MGDGATVALDGDRALDRRVESQVGRVLPDTPWTPAVVALVGASLFALARLLVAASGDPGWFVVAGRSITDAKRAGIPAGAGPGYDGQFFFRLALDAFSYVPKSHGIIVDSPLRFQRITYPFLAWVLSVGGRVLVPTALIVINLLALGALGWLGGMLARAGGRHAAWGILLPACFGFVFTLSRDLSEIVEVAFLVGGMVALRNQRGWTAALLLSGAVLGRETALFAVAGIAVARVVIIATRRDRAGRVDAAWIVPPLVFAGWQWVIQARTGTLAVTSASANEFVFPGSHLVQSIGDLLPDHSYVQVLHVMELVVLLAVLVLAVTSLNATTAPVTDRLAFIGVLLAALSVDIVEGIWVTLHDFRMFGDAYALAIVVLFGSRRNLTPVAAAVFTCTLGAAIYRVGVL